MRISEKAAAAAMVEQRETELVAAKNRLARTEFWPKTGQSLNSSWMMSAPMSKVLQPC